MNKADQLTLFKEIAEASSDEIFVTDEAGVIVYVNGASKRNYGFKAEELIGSFIGDLENRLFYPSATLAVMKQRMPIEMVQKTSLGKSLYVKSLPIFNSEQELTWIISFARDSTDIVQLRKRIQYLEQELMEQLNNASNSEWKRIIYQSTYIKKILQTIARVAQTNTAILLEGETGVGKSLFAKEIHNGSNMEPNHFYEINCANINQDEINWEIFSVIKDKETNYLPSSGSTIHLHEIDALSLEAQTNLLKFLEQSLEQSNEAFRIIASTNKNIEELIHEGFFRKELYYRLNTIKIIIPPLRDRGEDIKLLAEHFLKQFNKKYDTNVRLSKMILNAFYEYEWPGNVREMKNLIENLVITTEGKQVAFSQLPPKVRVGSISGAMTLPDRIEHFERTLILEAYDIYKSSYKVAQHLGISQSTATRKIKRYITEAKTKG